MQALPRSSRASAAMEAGRTSQQRAFDQLYEAQAVQGGLHLPDESRCPRSALLGDSTGSISHEEIWRRRPSPIALIPHRQLSELLYRRDAIPMEPPEKFDRKVRSGQTVETTDPSVEHDPSDPPARLLRDRLLAQKKSSSAASRIDRLEQLGPARLLGIDLGDVLDGGRRSLMTDDRATPRFPAAPS